MRLPEVETLLQTMRRIITSYPDTMIERGGVIPGTSFFPCGDGLYKGTSTISPTWPTGKIMVLGNDWGTTAGCDAIDVHELNGSTWRGLIALLEDEFRDRGLSLADCFFTNSFMGVRKSGPVDGECPGRSDAVFKSKCQAFLAQQAETQGPCLILTLGKWAPEMLSWLAPALAGWRLDTVEWQSLDAAGPLHENVELNVLPGKLVTVCALTHTDRPWLNYPNRNYGQYVNERGLLKAALDAAGFETTTDVNLER